MKRFSVFLLICVLLLFSSIVIAEGEEEKVDELLSGTVVEETEIADLFSSPEFMTAFNQRITGFDFALLKGNDLIKKEWLKALGIGPEDIGLDTFDGEFLKTLGEHATEFDVNNVEVDRVWTDGSVILKNRGRVFGGKISYEGEVHTIENGILDITDADSEAQEYFRMVDSKMVKDGIMYQRGDESPYGDYTRLATQSKLGLDSEDAWVIGVGENLVSNSHKAIEETDANGNLVTKFYGSVKLLDSGNKGLDTNSNAPYAGVEFFDGEESVFSVSRYLGDDKSPLEVGLAECSEGSGCIRLGSGERLSVKLSEFDRSKIRIKNNGGIEGLDVDAFKSDAEVFYQNGKGHMRIGQNGALAVRGEISQIGDVTLSDPSEPGRVFDLGGIFPSDVAKIVREYQLGNEIKDKISEMKDPVAILIGQQDYPGSDMDLQGTVNDINQMAAFLEESGIDSENIRMLKDASSQDIVSAINQLKKENPDSEFFFYYSGHGVEDGRSARTGIDDYGAVPEGMVGTTYAAMTQALEASDGSLLSWTPGENELQPAAIPDLATSSGTNPLPPAPDPNSVDLTLADNYLPISFEAELERIENDPAYASRGIERVGGDNSQRLGDPNYFLATPGGDGYNGLSSSELNKMLSDRNPIYVLDTCHSGGVCEGLTGRLRVSASGPMQQAQETTIVSTGETAGVFTSLLVGRPIDDVQSKGDGWIPATSVVISDKKSAWFTPAKAGGGQIPQVFEFAIVLI